MVTELLSRTVYNTRLGLGWTPKKAAAAAAASRGGKRGGSPGWAVCRAPVPTRWAPLCSSIKPTIVLEPKLPASTGDWSVAGLFLKTNQNGQQPPGGLWGPEKPTTAQKITKNDSDRLRGRCPLGPNHLALQMACKRTVLPSPLATRCGPGAAPS